MAACRPACQQACLERSAGTRLASLGARRAGQLALLSPARLLLPAACRSRPPALRWCVPVQLKDLKQELSALRVAKVTGGAPNKLSKIKVVRKGIARVLTVVNQKTREALKESYKGKVRPCTSQAGGAKRAAQAGCMARGIEGAGCRLGTQMLSTAHGRGMRCMPSRGTASHTAMAANAATNCCVGAACQRWQAASQRGRAGSNAACSMALSMAAGAGERGSRSTRSRSTGATGTAAGPASTQAAG